MRPGMRPKQLRRCGIVRKRRAALNQRMANLHGLGRLGQNGAGIPRRSTRTSQNHAGSVAARRLRSRGSQVRILRSALLRTRGTCRWIHLSRPTSASLRRGAAWHPFCGAFASLRLPLATFAPAALLTWPSESVQAQVCSSRSLVRRRRSADARARCTTRIGLQKRDLRDRPRATLGQRHQHTERL